MFKGHFISFTYFITSLIFGAFALLERSESLDIALNEIYFVLPKSLIWLVLAFFFLVFAGISLAFERSKKRINPYFFGAHYLLTIIGLVVIYFALPDKVSPEKYYDYSVYGDQTEHTINTVKWASYIIYLLIGAQLIFVMNVLLSILRSRKKKDN